MKVYLSCLFFFITFLAYSQDSLVVKGYLKGQGNLKVGLSFTNNEGKNERYNADATKGAFEFKVKKQALPVVVNFSSSLNRSLTKTENGVTYGNPAPNLIFFLKDADIKIKGTAADIQFAKVSGGRENKEYASLTNKLRSIEKKGWEIRKQTFYMNSKKDSIKIKKLYTENSEMSKKGYKIKKEFVKNNPGSFTSVFLLNRMKNFYAAADYAAAFENLSDEYKETVEAIRIQKNIDKYSSTSPGTQAITFIKKDKDGKEINLAAYKGKIVLLDFWGSWCGPCRASHPHLKDLYTQYKNKGFEIIAIAQEYGADLEESRKKWLAAIKEDNINWVHILNNEDKENLDLVKAYKVDAFPTKILLDKDGKILLRISASATNDIDKMLEEKLGK